jgi:hypothetical protein
MKKTILNNAFQWTSLMFILLIGVPSLAQQTVKASDIISAIKKGKDITYKDVTITGVLDLTFMNEKLPDLPKKRKWWKNGGSNTVKESIDSKISFVNCTFKDDVLAYIHDEDSGYTFIANFEDDVIFKNCRFKGDAMFKYSGFEGIADFSNATFEKSTTFKYADFDTKANFANTVFEEDAIFKYTEFKDGVSFNNARFKENLNIKYTQVNGDFDIKGMRVARDIDSKYTDINGKGLSNYLINKD